MPSPSIEIAVTGVQNRKILSGLLLSRLAAKNRAKNETARIQHKGEERPSRKPPTSAAKPVALELLIPGTSPVTNRATTIPATALRTPRRVITGLPPGSLRSVFYSENAPFDRALLKNLRPLSTSAPGFRASKRIPGMQATLACSAAALLLKEIQFIRSRFAPFGGSSAEVGR